MGDSLQLPVPDVAELRARAERNTQALLSVGRLRERLLSIESEDDRCDDASPTLLALLTLSRLSALHDAT